ncbi:DedA family protein [Microlunatus soli]|uniref:Membrane protein DedA, SNARE-associated domain n=1 Tax=Microlunatus soli TaxID=630515 RepID=A0A1H1WU44_9ACTN|nr:VTT domain-containing protein [Microlunatus soli]SDT00595.1 membrane protein DedA, SNARE-associated domain [Microlunatus soli]
MDVLSQFILAAAGSPWVLLAVAALIIIDGIFPLVPSESIVIGLAAIGVGTGHPSLLILGIVAAAAAWVGDNLAYEIGRGIGITRFRWMHRPWFTKAMTKAAAALDRRVSSAVLAGRFIPGGRVAISLVAGATRIPRRVYRPLTVASSTLWAIYSLVIGTIGGAWVAAHPVLGVGLAIGLGMIVGFAVDQILALIRRRRAARIERAELTRAADREPTPVG